MASIGTAYIQIAPNMTGVQGKIAGGLRGTGSKFANQFSSEVSGRSAVIIGAVAGAAQAAVQKAMRLVGNSIGDAVSRVDTLKRFPTVMQNLGYKSKDAASEIDRISSSLIGLPTSLDSLTTFVQRVAPVSGSLKEATDVALAFNNAVLAGGGPVSRQGDAIEQFSQMLSKGVPDMMAWRTLQEAMPATLGQVAKKLGIASGNTSELYEQLKDGVIGFDDFTGAVVDLDKKGLPGFKNFADQAKDATGGIATGVANMQTAITRGVAGIIESVGAENVSSAIAGVGKAFESVLNKIAIAVPPVLAVLTSVFGFVARNKDVFLPIVVAVGTMVGLWKAWTIATGIATAAQALFNVVMSANPIGLIIIALAGLVAGLVYFFTKTKTGQAIISQFGAVVSKVWASIQAGLARVGAFFSSTFARIKSIVGGVVGFIKARWPLLLAIITGPIGLAVYAVSRNIDRIKGFFASGYNYIKGLWGRLSGFFTGIFNRIRGAFTGMAGIGRNIVQGLWNGISGMGNWLKDKIIAFVSDKIPGPVKKVLGINSPSKLFAEFGKNIDQGLAQGVDKNSGMVSNSVNSMANEAIDAMKTSDLNAAVAMAPNANFNGGASGTGNTQNQTVSIGNIVLGDQSAVKEFFKQLNQDTINVGMGLTPVQGAQ